MRKKIIILLAAMLMLAVALAGCSSTSSATQDTNGKIVIKFLHKWPEPQNAPYFDQVVKDFEKLHPNIVVQTDAIADGPIKDKLRVILGGNDVPDIFFSWSGEFARKFVRAGAALDLTPFLNSDAAWKNSFVSSSLQPFQTDGKNYGIPIDLDAKFFVYNKAIFAKYNLQVPQTYDQFLQICSTLKQNGVTPIIFGNQDPWAAIHYLTGFNQKLVPQDTRMKDYNPKTGAFTDSGYVQAMQMLVDLNKNGYFMKNANATSHDMAKQLFFAGKGAMFYLELVEFPDVEQAMKGNWGFFPMPEISGAKGDQNMITGAPDGFLVSSKTKHPKEAVEFLKFLTSKEEASKLTSQLGWPSPVKGATTQQNAIKQVAEGVDALNKADGMAIWLDTDVNAKVADSYLSNAQLLLDGTKTPNQVIKEIQSVAKQVQSSN